jgi:hypothetical protein
MFLTMLSNRCLMPPTEQKIVSKACNPLKIDVNSFDLATLYVMRIKVQS